MSKDNSGLFQGTIGDRIDNHLDFPANGIDYNTASSSTVRQVDSIVETHDAHSVSPHGKPNSVLKNYQSGILTSERYYDARGDAYLDIDYTDHGNPNGIPMYRMNTAFILLQTAKWSEKMNTMEVSENEKRRFAGLHQLRSRNRVSI